MKPFQSENKLLLINQLYLNIDVRQFTLVNTETHFIPENINVMTEIAHK